MHFHVKEREVGGWGGVCVASFSATASGCVFSVLGPFSTSDNANRWGSWRWWWCVCDRWTRTFWAASRTASCRASSGPRGRGLSVMSVRTCLHFAWCAWLSACRLLLEPKRSGVLWTQKSRSPLLRTHSWQIFSFVKPEAGQNIAIHASPTARIFFLVLISTFLVCSS